ncbi:hypothetical protein SELMODRAFT_402187 [Selaginella moellendorffii]|uniref:Pentacotripeptide-repeat region of PRORP domain-containing protein n=1 Tax=Selaginella moellendorffii TaxID=88036 RepID=D8QPV6_SELML|nr:uncharacterized protein LOC9663127 [Selaginella moellendorffii]EFJ38348.1 hypothetical protein SELMODRAFT_402187 [Selaginella moellendorffii]|eukprot:XP_002960809.1 uncharacterized protein LOC9663127 [Selaginella moellendorffii]
MAMRGMLRAWKGAASRSLELNRFRAAAAPSCARGCSTVADEKQQREDERSKKKEEEEKQLVKLCKSIADKPEESTQAIKDWVAQGNRLKYKNYLQIAKTLADHPKLHREAVKLLKTSRNEKIVESRTASLILELGLVLREFGVAPAERFYSRLPVKSKSEELTVAFVTSLAKRYPKHALRWVQGLNPTTAELHNAIIRVYWKLKMHDKMLAAYTTFRNDPKLLPKLETYLLMLKYKERVGGLEGLEEEIRAFVEKIRIRKANVYKLDHLMEVYAFLGDADKVEKIYKFVKTPKPPQVPLRDSFRVAVRAFGRLGMVKRAEEVVEDSKDHAKESFRLVNLIEVYSKAGMMDKAEELLEKIDKSKRTFAPYDALVRGYLAKNDSKKALERFKEGCAVRSVVPSYETVAALLPVLEELKFWKSAEGLMQNYLHHAAGDVRLYNSFLKVYGASQRKADSSILSRFKIEADSETLELLSRVKIMTGDGK